MQPPTGASDRDNEPARVGSFSAVIEGADPATALSPGPEMEGRQERNDPAMAWKRNRLLVYTANFMHMTMATLCLGGVWDNFIYLMSEQQRVFVPFGSDFILTENATSMGPWSMQTFVDYEVMADIRLLGQPPPNCGTTWDCRALIYRISNGDDYNSLPALFLHNGTSLRLIMDTKTRHIVCDSKTKLEPGRWYHVKVKQADSDRSKGEFAGDRWVGLFIDDEPVCGESVAFDETLGRMQAVLSLGAGSSVDSVPMNLGFLRYRQPGSNTYVGWINTIQGVMGVVIMYPIGWLGDLMNRYCLVKANLIFGILTAALLVPAVRQESNDLLLGGVVVFACYQQCLSSIIYTILSDNTPKGQRNRSAVNYKTLSALAFAFGPAIQLFVLLCLPSADVWTIKTFELLLLPGWALLAPVVLSVLFLKPVGLQLSSVPNADEVARQVPRDGRTQTLTDSWLEHPVTVFSWKRRYVVAVSAQVFFMATLLANGMSVKYFTLYYTQVLNLSPLQLCLLQGGMRLWVAGTIRASAPLARFFGRARLCVSLHLGAAFFTFGIYGGGLMSKPPMWLSVPCYFLRYGFLQARDPLLYSITMDIVPERQKSRWAALNSLRSMSFSASALLGGYLADTGGYEFSFQVTVVALFACTIFFVPVLLYFPYEEGWARQDQADELLTQDPISSSSRPTVNEEMNDYVCRSFGNVQQNPPMEQQTAPELLLSLKGRVVDAFRSRRGGSRTG